MQRKPPAEPTKVLPALIAASLLLGGGAVLAGVPLSPIMSSWNHNLHMLDDMLQGQTPYDPVAVRQAIELYIGDASTLANHLHGNSASARDFRDRFTTFAAEGRRALGSAADPAALRRNLRQMVGTCHSCHAAYN